MGLVFAAGLLLSTLNTNQKGYCDNNNTTSTTQPHQTTRGRTTGASSFSSDLTSLSWFLGAALFANIPMMPFCGLAEGFEARLASPFMPDFLCSGSSVGDCCISLACCSSRLDTGTAAAQRIALYLQTERRDKQDKSTLS